MRLFTLNGSKRSGNGLKPPNACSTWANGGKHSRPWTVDEYLLVDGIACTYSVCEGGVVVHLPGRVDVALALLRESRLVQEPSKWRIEGFE